jgi:twitching motility protein PilI
MAKGTAQSPLEILRDIERNCMAHAHELPQQIEIAEEWSGIGFRLGDLRLLAPLGEVVEVLTYPGLSKVPRTRSWVRGIANVRGNLLPIMDLQAYLEGRPATMTRRSRVLVVNHKGVFSGLVVDEVLGLKHFLNEEQVPETPVEGGAIAEYLRHGFRRKDEHWGVFSMYSLAESPQFLQAAV